VLVVITTVGDVDQDIWITVVGTFIVQDFVSTDRI